MQLMFLCRRNHYTYIRLSVISHYTVQLILYLQLYGVAYIDLIRPYLILIASTFRLCTLDVSHLITQMSVNRRERS